jgi:hypothetical protein
LREGKELIFALTGAMFYPEIISLFEIPIPQLYSGTDDSLQ